MLCRGMWQRAWGEHPLTAAAGQLRFQVDRLNTREDVQLNSNNNDLKKNQTKQTQTAFAIFVCQKFPKLLAGWHEVPVEFQVPKSTIPVVGDINTSASGKKSTNLDFGGFSPPPSRCLRTPRSSHQHPAPRAVGLGCPSCHLPSGAGNARNRSHHPISCFPRRDLKPVGFKASCFFFSMQLA